MRRQLVIIGNSGAARECYWLAQDMIEAGADFEFKGFLAFEGYEGDLKDLSEMSLGDDDAYTPAEIDVFAIGIGDPKLRMRVYEKWRARKVSFISLIHPTAALQRNVVYGEANIFTRDVAISCDVVIGDANFFNGGVIVGHDAMIGNGNVFSPKCVFLGGITVGNENIFGVQSVMLPRAHVGSKNVIAPGAFVYKGCRDACTMAGNPALKVAP